MIDAINNKVRIRITKASEIHFRCDLLNGKEGTAIEYDPIANILLVKLDQEFYPYLTGVMLLQEYGDEFEIIN